MIMKRVNRFRQVMPVELVDGVELLQQWKRNPLSIGLFLMMCLNLVIAPAVYASAGEAITRKAAWAIGILALVILGLAIYLFAVILQPERF
jgi:K+-transporting ATPase KdpF subunit